MGRETTVDYVLHAIKTWKKWVLTLKLPNFIFGEGQKVWADSEHIGTTWEQNGNFIGTWDTETRHLNFLKICNLLVWKIIQQMFYPERLWSIIFLSRRLQTVIQVTYGRLKSTNITQHTRFLEPKSGIIIHRGC
jgi:hypothetical protein